MANVSISDVRDTINVSEADIPDAKLQKMVKRAEVTLELELGKEIEYSDCTEAEKVYHGAGCCLRDLLFNGRLCGWLKLHRGRPERQRCEQCTTACRASAGT